MPLQASDLLVPDGDLPTDLLPVPPEERTAYASRKAYLTALIGAVGDEEGAEASGWLKRAAEAAPDSEAAQRAFVYARAYRLRYQRALQDPTRIDREGQGSTQYAVTQVSDWGVLADEWEAEYDRLSGSGAPAVAMPASTADLASRALYP